MQCGARRAGVAVRSMTGRRFFCPARCSAPVPASAASARDYNQAAESHPVSLYLIPLSLPLLNPQPPLPLSDSLLSKIVLK